ncbi:MAG: hypothetical protein HKL84_10865 [Acidimicrobiaceae bacterium]|nr:hypothetical protein [Acidimicrobiaceae bacterium]
MIEHSANLNLWLTTEVLPFWATKGRDYIGFVEKMSLDGTPLTNVKRCRVQTRQIYCFSEAGRLGWNGPWADLVRHGLSFLLSYYPRSDGSFFFSVNRDGTPLDDAAKNYDLAFVIFSLAHASSSLGERSLEMVALGVLDFLERERSNPMGGFYEGNNEDPVLCLANPHMHLFEAALAWREIAGSSLRWQMLADSLGELATSSLIDPKTGSICEHYDSAWRPVAVREHPSVEPGHQFEWAWLLLRWRQHSEIIMHAARLYEFGAAFGIDPEHDIVINEVEPSGRMADAGARLWPQTEWIKAASAISRCADGGHEPRFETDLDRAVRALKLFLRSPHPSLWHDRFKDGKMVADVAAATSLYHIVGAISELNAHLSVKG